MEAIHIDGSRGEGGGQILRSALTLSMITGRPFVIENIRAGRSKPGMLKQHLACVKAAQTISGAQVEGAELGSTTLSFQPDPIQPGDYRFSVGSAGSASLVLQTVVLPLALTGPSEVTVEGGTHNQAAPPFEFLAETYQSAARACGFPLDFTLARHGFYPAGGGVVKAVIGRSHTVETPLAWLKKTVADVQAVALMSQIPGRIGVAEAERLAIQLGIPQEKATVRTVDSPGPGNAVVIRVCMDGGTAVFTGFGARGLPLERVVDEVAQEALDFIASAARVDAHLQDQILLPLALGPGGQFRTGRPTEHARTNAEVIGRFLPVTVEWQEQSTDDWMVVVRRN